MWFAVPIYFRSSEPVGGEVLIEEAIHLVDAGSDEEAVEKATSLSKKLAHRYRSVSGKEVVWSLHEIGEPWEILDELKDGAEVHSRLMTKGNLEALQHEVAAD
jgi:hypothetical protein